MKGMNLIYWRSDNSSGHLISTGQLQTSDVGVYNVSTSDFLGGDFSWLFVFLVSPISCILHSCNVVCISVWICGFGLALEES